jgi:predicted ArsR family transcriptional regulator
MITENGPSVVFLPSPRLDRKNLDKASGLLGQLAKDLGISTKQVRDEVRSIIEDELAARDEVDRFGVQLG